MIGGIASGVGDIFGGIGGMVAAKNRKRELADANSQYYFDKQQQEDKERALERDPTYVSELTGPYQRSQSPVARAYLESLLTGQNADAANSPWSDPGDRNKAVLSSRGTFGAYDDLVARGVADRGKTPWAVSKPEEIYRPDRQGIDGWAVKPGGKR